MKNTRRSNLAGIPFLTALIFTLACSSLFRPTPPPTLMQGESGLVYADDFAQPREFWKTWYGEDGSYIDFQGGGLRVFVNQPGYDYWSTLENMQFEDVKLKVDAAMLSGPEDNIFGLMCRHNKNERFYAFVITSDGYYGILAMDDKEYTILNKTQLSFSDQINRGVTFNTIEAECIGHKLALYANGILLAEAEDNSYTSGKVGVIAGSYKTPGVDIYFDNFEASLP